MAVFVLDNDGNPLMPCSEKRARILLGSGKARLHCFWPFSIRLTDHDHRQEIRQNLTLKICPGSESTGFAIVRQDEESTRVLFLAELVHRGSSVIKSLLSRKWYRRRRRSENLRYRAPRFLNRRKPAGWLPPSIVHRVETVDTWVRRFSKIAPITSVIAEVAPLDPRELKVVSAIEASYNEDRRASELRTRVYENWGRKCIYCNDGNSSLHLDHIVARSEGGSNRVSNLVPACPICNRKKGKLSIQEFLKDRPGLLQSILRTMRASMRDLPPLFGMRRGIRENLRKGPIALEFTTFGSSQANLRRLKLLFSPALRAACTGVTGTLTGWDRPILRIRSIGRGSYRRSRSYRPGLTKGHHPNRLILTRKKMHKGFRSGDFVKGVMTHGKNRGVHRGRVAVRAVGAMDLITTKGKIIAVQPTNGRLIQRGDGYAYSFISALRKGVAQSALETASGESSKLELGTKRTKQP